ncbi:MAG TPA: hypothetical protein VM345_10980 [Acidimicrobiales bacterium]|nr:hypothetical protein [Acidimicrobiales bacterium]
MGTATKLGAVLGTGLLGMMLLGSPAMAGPEHSKKSNGTEQTTTDAAPGKADRTTEAGGSGTQGRSESNPDGGGVDKPYAAAGQPAESQGDGDYDGNNGCGNDADFADDNNGNCGGLKKGHSKEKPAPPTGGNNGGNTGGNNGGNTGGNNGSTDGGNTGGTTTETGSSATGSGTVLGTNEAAVAGAMGIPGSGAQVLGVQYERPAASAAGERAAVAATNQTGTTGASVLGLQLSRVPETLAATGLPLGLAALLGFGLIGGGVATRRFARK